MSGLIYKLDSEQLAEMKERAEISFGDMLLRGHYRTSPGVFSARRTASEGTRAIFSGNLPTAIGTHGFVLNPFEVHYVADRGFAELQLYPDGNGETPSYRQRLEDIGEEGIGFRETLKNSRGVLLEMVLTASAPANVLTMVEGTTGGALNFVDVARGAEEILSPEGIFDEDGVRLYKVQELADLTGMNPSSLSQARYRQSGKLKARKVKGMGSVVREDDFVDFVWNHTRPHSERAAVLARLFSFNGNPHNILSLEGARDYLIRVHRLGEEFIDSVLDNTVPVRLRGTKDLMYRMPDLDIRALSASAQS